MTNAAEELALLREDADVRLQQMDRIEARAEPTTAEDESGEVVVRLDKQGMVHAVTIGFAWDRSLKREELPVAVIEALGKAKMARLEHWGEAAASVEDEPADRPRPMDTTRSAVTVLQERLAGASTQETQDYIEGMLRDLQEGVEEANAALDAHLERSHTGRSSSGRVSATAIANGDVTAVEFDDAWLAKAHPANLGREVTQAVTDAITRSQRDGLAAAIRASKLSRLAELAVAPEPTDPT